MKRRIARGERREFAFHALPEGCQRRESRAIRSEYSRSRLPGSPAAEAGTMNRRETRRSSAVDGAKDLIIPANRGEFDRRRREERMTRGVGLAVSCWRDKLRRECRGFSAVVSGMPESFGAPWDSERRRRHVPSPSCAVSGIAGSGRGEQRVLGVGCRHEFDPPRCVPPGHRGEIRACRHGLSRGWDGSSRSGGVPGGRRDPKRCTPGRDGAREGAQRIAWHP